MKQTKKNLTAGALMLLALNASTMTVHAENKPAENTEITKNVDTKNHNNLIQVLLNVFMINTKPEFGKITVDKDNNKITILDTKIDFDTMKVVYPKIEIYNFQEKAAGEFSIAALKIFDMKSEFSAKYKEQLEKDLAKDVKDPDQLKLLTAMSSGDFSFKEVTYTGINFSQKEDTLSTQKGEFKGFQLSKTVPLDFSKVEGKFTNFKVTRLNAIRKLNEQIMTKLPEMENNPQKMMQTIASLYSGFNFESMSLTGFPEFTGPKGEKFKFGEIYAAGMKNGVLDQLSLKDVDVQQNSPDKSAPNDIKIGKFGSITLSGINFSGLMKHKGTFSKTPSPNPAEAVKIFQFIKGFSLKNIDTVGVRNSFKGNIAFNWDNYIGLFPTKVGIDIDADIQPPKDGQASKEVAELLKVTGLKKLDMKLNIGIEWNEKEKQVVFKPFLYDLNKMVTVNFSASMENITREMLAEQDPQKLAVIGMGANMGPLTLEVTDKGILKLYDDQAKMTWEAMSTQFAADPNMKPLIDNINKFIANPKGKLKIVLKPKGLVNIAQLVTAVKLGPNMLFSLYDVESSYIEVK